MKRRSLDDVIDSQVYVTVTVISTEPHPVKVELVDAGRLGLEHSRALVKESVDFICCNVQLGEIHSISSLALDSFGSGEDRDADRIICDLFSADCILIVEQSKEHQQHNSNGKDEPKFRSFFLETRVGILLGDSGHLIQMFC